MKSKRVSTNEVKLKRGLFLTKSKIFIYEVNKRFALANKPKFGRSQNEVLTKSKRVSASRKAKLKRSFDKVKMSFCEP